MEEMACCVDEPTIPFRYIKPNMALTHEQIRRIRDENLQVLLRRKKLKLLLDLDHTLIHARQVDQVRVKDKERIKSADDVYDIMGGAFIVKLRPGIREFLKEVGSMFNVSVYTMGQRAYANAVHDLLVSKVGFPKGSWVIAREDCVVDQQKRLDVVLSHEKVVLIVDDKPEVWGHSSGKDNVVKIDRYDFFPIKKGNEGVIDTELARVLNILKGVHASFFKEDNEHIDYSRKDVRGILKSIISPALNDSVVDTESTSDAQTKSCTKVVIKLGGKRLRPEINDISDVPTYPKKPCARLTKKLGRKLVIKLLGSVAS